MHRSLMVLLLTLFALTLPSPGYSFEKEIDKLFLRGSFNDWGVMPFTLVDDHLWEVTTYVASDNAEFKFDLFGDWSHNYGDNDRDGVGDRNGNNISLRYGKGHYRISFDDISRNYSVEKIEEMGLPPRVDAGLDIVINEGEVAKFSARRTKAGDGKIVSYVWSNGLTGVTAEKTYNVPGSYVVKLTVTDEKGLTATDSVNVLVNALGTRHNFKQLYVRGTNNDWGKTKMVAKGEYVWELQTEFGFDPKERFKFDVNGDWRSNFGDNNSDGIADKNGSDIFVGRGAGRYRITFNDQTLEYRIEKL